MNVQPVVEPKANTIELNAFFRSIEQGGVTLRMETGVQLPGSYVGNITGRNIICRDGSSGFLANPHSQQNGDFYVYDVQAYSCFMGIHLVGSLASA